jgi:hypothetical protein
MRHLKYPAALIFFGSLLSLPLLFPAKQLCLRPDQYRNWQRTTPRHRRGRAFRQQVAAWACPRIF